MGIDKMDAQDFEKIVALGLGRAVLHLREHDAHPYRAIILDACVHNRAYDAQVEGARAEYALDLMRSSGDVQFYENEVIQSLAQEAGDHDTVQRFRLSRLLAQNGNRSARQAMRSAFETKGISMSGVAAEFVELDGIEGLLFVVAQIGEQLGQDAGRWEDDYLLSVAGDLCGRDAVEVALKKAAETDKNVRLYLAAVEKNRAKRVVGQRHDPKPLTYDDVRSLIEANNPDGRLVKWGQKASDSDAERAAHDLIQETDLKKLRLYLLMFRKRPFPLDYGHLLRLVELPDGPVPRHALRALANLEQEVIRKLAFKLVEARSSLRGYAIDLLIRNFRDGDHAIIEGWCETEQDLSTVNAYDISLRDFFAAHPNLKSEVRLLKRFYETEPCAHCRCFAVERLLELNGLPEVLKHECQHDSYEETRELVTQLA
jgi:hypothetical protein